MSWLSLQGTSSDRGCLSPSRALADVSLSCNLSPASCFCLFLHGFVSPTRCTPVVPVLGSEDLPGLAASLVDIVNSRLAWVCTVRPCLKQINNNKGSHDESCSPAPVGANRLHLEPPVHLADWMAAFCFEFCVLRRGRGYILCPTLAPLCSLVLRGLQSSHRPSLDVFAYCLNLLSLDILSEPVSTGQAFPGPQDLVF